MNKIFACFLLGCVVLTFGAKQKRMSNGRLVTSPEIVRKFPFMVYAVLCGTDRQCNYCTGTLIKLNRVLLAAHCFCGLKGGASEIRVWSMSVRRGRSSVDPRDGFRMMGNLPSFRCRWRNGNILKRKNDVAVVRLLKIFYAPIVPLYCGKAVIGWEVTMLGYGYTEKNVTGRLRVATGRIAACPSKKEQSNLICVSAGPGKPTLLREDSGGPLLVKLTGKFFQIGVASIGTGNVRRRRGVPTWNFFAKVSTHCQRIKHARMKSAGQRSAIGTTELVIQSFVLIVILNF